MKIGFIGAGQMATALAVGMSNSDSETELFAFDPSEKAMSAFCNLIDNAGNSVQRCDSNQSVIDQCEFVFLAIKPQVLQNALQNIEPPPNRCVFVSVVAGATIETLANLLHTEKVIRTMPNTPCLIGKGAIAIAKSNAISIPAFNTIKLLLSEVGEVVEVAEHMIDAVTGLSGSGPAFVYTFVESLVDAGVLAGLPRDTARKLAMQTVHGSVRMLMTSNSHPAQLRDNVTSPGGTTIYGMEKLEQLGFRESVMAAVRAATDRSKELSGQ